MKILTFSVLFSLYFLPGYCQESSLTDKRDGQVYTAVKIGQDVWMQENLKFIHQSAAYKKPKKKINKFGNFYNNSATQELCPEGWHIPLLSEWDAMIDILVEYRNISNADFSVEIKEETVATPNDSEEKYDTRYSINNSKKLKLFKAPLLLKPYGWIQKGRRIKNLNTANLWIIDDKDNLVNFHIHAGNHNYNSHAHKHHIEDSKERIRYLNVRCVQNN